MVLPGHHYGTRAATGASSAVTPPPAGLPPVRVTPAAAVPVSAPDVYVIDVRSARQAAWVRPWTTAEVLRAYRVRAGMRPVSRAAGVRKRAAAALASANHATGRKASGRLAQVCYRTRRWMKKQRPKWAWATAPRGARRYPSPCVERR